MLGAAKAIEAAMQHFNWHLHPGQLMSVLVGRGPASARFDTVVPCPRNCPAPITNAIAHKAATELQQEIAAQGKGTKLDSLSVCCELT
jgi:hypothetical protein